MRALYRNEPGFGGDTARLDFTLFVGPPTCYYHNCGGMQGRDNVAAFCPNDYQMSLGLVEEEIVQAVGEIKQTMPSMQSIVVLSACQSAFEGLDFAQVQAAVQHEHSLLCLHRENCRILMARPGSTCDRGPGDGARDARRRTGGKQDFMELARLIPQERSIPGSGLLFMGGSAKLDSRSELFQVARDWGFDWVQSLGDWTSLQALEFARSADYAIVAKESLLPLAEFMHERWGMGFTYLPDTCRLEEVDDYYDFLSGEFGCAARLGAYRDAAVDALCRVRDTWVGYALDIAAPSCVVQALFDLSVEVQEAKPWGMPPRPRLGGKPGMPLSRSGDEHYPTSGPAIRPQRPGMPHGSAPAAQLPERASVWGYLGIYDAMTRLCEGGV